MAENNNSDNTKRVNEVAPKQAETIERKARGPYKEPDLSSIFPLRSRVISTTQNTGNQRENGSSTTTSSNTGNAGGSNNNNTDTSNQGKQGS